jgi:hypothetical protein
LENGQLPAPSTVPRDESKTATTAAVDLTAQAPADESPRLTSRWWFWAGIGGAVVLTTAVVLYATSGSGSPDTKLGNHEFFP